MPTPPTTRQAARQRPDQRTTRRDRSCLPATDGTVRTHALTVDPAGARPTSDADLAMRLSASQQCGPVCTRPEAAICADGRAA